MIIYKATNLVNGKRYVGQTKKTLQKRMTDHRNAKDNLYFHNAIRKYGIENFKWEIIYECQDKNILDVMETFKIMVNKSHISENGYNMSWGGESGTNGYKFTNEQLETMRKTHSGELNGFFGRQHTEETKSVLRKKNIGKKLTEETKRKIGESSKGRKMSEETKKKMSETRKKCWQNDAYRQYHTDRVKGDKNPMSKKNVEKRKQKLM